MAPSFQGDCSQFGNSRFLFSKNGNKKVWKTCNDLAGRNAPIIRKACGRDYGNGKEAKFMCRVTCGTCPSECELRVEELEKQNAELEKLTAALQRSLADLKAQEEKLV